MAYSNDYVNKSHEKYSQAAIPAFLNNNKKRYLENCIAPTQSFGMVLNAESTVCYPGNTTDRQLQ
jgi:hypothetical protein